MDTMLSLVIQNDYRLSEFDVIFKMKWLRNAVDLLNIYKFSLKYLKIQNNMQYKSTNGQLTSINNSIIQKLNNTFLETGRKLNDE